MWHWEISEGIYLTAKRCGSKLTEGSQWGCYFPTEHYFDIISFLIRKCKCPSSILLSQVFWLFFSKACWSQWEFFHWRVKVVKQVVCVLWPESRMSICTCSQIYVIFLQSRKIIMFLKIAFPSFDIVSFTFFSLWLHKNSGCLLWLWHNCYLMFAEHNSAQ